MGDVINLALKSEDNRRWTIRDMLLAVVAEIDVGKIDFNECVLILRKDLPEQNVAFGWRAVNVNLARAMELCEFQKLEFYSMRQQNVI